MHDTAYKIGSIVLATYVPPTTDAIVVEIGALDVNGSLRHQCPAHALYVGVDAAAGKSVDIVTDPGLPLPFRDGSADVVISSSQMEHDAFFWETFIEMVRILRDGGILYMNAPSNGEIHRYPADAWRFYPDAGRSLVAWAKRKRFDLTLIESFVGQKLRDQWNDFVAIFMKGPPQHAKYRFVSDVVECDNVWRIGEDDLVRARRNTEDADEIATLKVEIERLRLMNEPDRLSSTNRAEALLKDALEQRQILPRDIELLEEKIEPGFYRAQAPEIDFSRLSPARHFAVAGWRAGLDPNPEFSTSGYLALHAGVREAAINPYLHFLSRGAIEARAFERSKIVVQPEGASGAPPATPVKDEPSASRAAFRGPAANEVKAMVEDAIRRRQILPRDIKILEARIDKSFYAAQAPTVDFTEISPAEHFAVAGWRAGLDPAPDFSTRAYLALNPDVQHAAINPYLHHLARGAIEGRRFERSTTRTASGAGAPLASDRDYILDHVRSDLEKFDPKAPTFTVSLAGADLGDAVSAMSFRRAPVSGDATAEADASSSPHAPCVSIIIPCVNQEQVTAECLQSIANGRPAAFDIEVIVADNASSDGVYQAVAEHPDIRSIRFEQNIGFGPACNGAAKVARGEFLFFLNNDAQIAPGCLEALVAAMCEGASANIGIVGPKLLSFNGRLQEAGCLLNADGTGSLIGWTCDPEAPRYNYRRAVEHVSGAAILIRRALFEEVGGFDPTYAPAYCEDADLSLRLRQRGLAIVYEPAAVVAHHLSKTSTDPVFAGFNADKAELIARNCERLRRRWGDLLARTDLRTLGFHPHRINRDPWSANAMEGEAARARAAGLDGFCYAYHRKDHDPAAEASKPGPAALNAEFPFCLCWTIENGAPGLRRLGPHTLAEHSSLDEAGAIAEDLCGYFSSDRYIRVAQRPLLLVAGLEGLADPLAAIQALRDRCRASGSGDICVAMIEPDDTLARPASPAVHGCDFAIDAPADRATDSRDYRDIALGVMRRAEAYFPRFRSVLAPAGRHGDVLPLDHAGPDAFQTWLEWTYRRTMEQNLGDERIMFVVASTERGNGDVRVVEWYGQDASARVIAQALTMVDKARGVHAAWDKPVRNFRGSDEAYISAIGFAQDRAAIRVTPRERACSVCGGTEFTSRRVLWQALIDEWQITPNEVEYIDRQQGETCAGCGSNLRSLVLADAFLAVCGWKSTLSDFASSTAAAGLAVLEVNEAGSLHAWLGRFPGHVFAAYPQVDMHSMPYADASFDVVVHSDTLEHVPNPSHALAECRRVLKPGGALCFTVPVIAGRLSRNREGLAPSYHGNASERRDDWLVRTEFGADVWTYVMRAGFDEVTLTSRDFPVDLAVTAHRRNA